MTVAADRQRAHRAEAGGMTVAADRQRAHGAAEAAMTLGVECTARSSSARAAHRARTNPAIGRAACSRATRHAGGVLLLRALHGRAPLDRLASRITPPAGDA